MNINLLSLSNNKKSSHICVKYSSEDVYTAGKSANCDLTPNWAQFNSMAGQRLYTIQRRRPISARPRPIILLSLSHGIPLNKFRSSQVPGTSSSQFSSSGNFKFRNSKISEKYIKTLFAKIVFVGKTVWYPIIFFSAVD